jgi:hypothetical protein
MSRKKPLQHIKALLVPEMADDTVAGWMAQPEGAINIYCLSGRQSTMVNQFSLIRSPRILFGKGQLEALRVCSGTLAAMPLVLTGSKSHTIPVLGKTLLNLKNEDYTPIRQD